MIRLSVSLFRLAFCNHIHWFCSATFSVCLKYCPCKVISFLLSLLSFCLRFLNSVTVSSTLISFTFLAVYPHFHYHIDLDQSGPLQLYLQFLSILFLLYPLVNISCLHCFVDVMHYVKLIIF